MTLEPYPNDDDLQQLVAARAILATASGAPGPDGFDLDALASVVYAYGWAYRIDRATGVVGYRVELQTQRGIARQPVVSAVGWEPEVALTFALAQALTQRGGQSLAARGGSKEAVTAE